MSFVTENTDGTKPIAGAMRVAGVRNVGLARVRVDTEMPDASFGAPYTVTTTDGAGKATMVQSAVAWITDSTDPGRCGRSPSSPDWLSA